MAKTTQNKGKQKASLRIDPHVYQKFGPMVKQDRMSLVASRNEGVGKTVSALCALYISLSPDKREELYERGVAAWRKLLVGVAVDETDGKPRRAGGHREG